MAIDALSLPFDITWQRLAWTRALLDRSYTGARPLKWQSSLAINIYPVPLADTVADYPDHRIFYLKVSASVTGWSPNEEIQGQIVAEPGDIFHQEGWQVIAQSPTGRNYWPCVGAIMQVSVFPRPEAGVADDDYPFIVDFEPKKRELYEAVTETGEVLSGSFENVNTRKGSTTTHSVGVNAELKVPIPMLGQALGAVGAGYGWEREKVDITTTDRSTERREVVGHTTQLAQMYQLFNGYHVGTNRAVFAMFPRPHTVSQGQQIEYSLIRGERQLEGMQDIFVIVQVPRSIPGVCVRAHLDSAHKGPTTPGQATRVVVTRRAVGGCGVWEGDRLRSVPPPGEPPRLQIVGEYEMTMPPPSPSEPTGHGLGLPPRPPKAPTLPPPDWTPEDWTPGSPARVRRDGRVALADTLNTAQSQIQQAMLANAASGAYQPVDFFDSDTFSALAGEQLSQSPLALVHLERLGHLTTEDRVDLAAQGITTVGQLFAAGRHASHDKSPTPGLVRQQLLRVLTRSQPAR